MEKSTRIAPPNSVVLVCDAGGGEIPTSMQGALISSTPSCIAIGCRAEDDGETDIALGAIEEVDPGTPSAFEGTLSTPTRKVVVRSVLGQTVLEAAVPSRNTRVRVWVNDQSEPDRVVVGFA